MELIRLDKCTTPFVPSGSVLTVLGCGASLAGDVARVGIVGDVMAISDAVAYYPGRLDHAVSCHNRMIMRPLLRLRAARGYNRDFICHSPAGDETDFTDMTWQLIPDIPGSGYFAAAVGIGLGYAEVRLLGCGLDGEGHFYDFMPGAATPYAETFLETWRSRARLFKGVRAASGPLADVLGRIE